VNGVDEELLFRIIFSSLWVIFLANLLWVNRSASWFSDRQTTTHATRLRVVAIGFAWLYLAGVMLYAFFTSSIIFLFIPFPDWFRFVMGGVAIAGLLFLTWALRALGKNWAPSLSGVRKNTLLVTAGPYQIVRHPIYFGAFIFLAALAFVASNWTILVPTVALLVLLYAQLGDEETLLINRFGEEYREYMKRTPRFMPMLKRRDTTTEKKDSLK
jgi:protein-S-isoprenylcysteine O-methyltransferase Ste14